MKAVQLILIASLGVLWVTGSPLQKENKRLIKTSESQPAEWMDEKQIWTLIEKHANFVDVTDHKFPQIGPMDVNIKAIPNTLRFESTVKEILTLISVPRMEEFVSVFSNYHNRYYESATGIASQQWLLFIVQESVRGYAGNAVVNTFDHAWSQKSIVARITGSDPTLRSEVVILGAHQDSINMFGSSMGAPGADDNASGSVILLETLRVLVAGGFIPKRTIEFHWYAAEEVGLRGSGEIARQYNTNGVDVVAMLNLDVAGYYVQGTNDIGIYTDYTNAALNQFLRMAVDGYCDFGWRNRVCGYGCSDHASWNSYGFPACMPSEVVLHPQMHTTRDDMASVNFNQVKEFNKLAIAFIVEISEPSN